MVMPSKGSDANHRIVIALGDPAGIGMEVILKALASSALPSKLHPKLVGCRQSIELTYARLKARGISPLANPKNLDIQDLPLESKLQPGHPTAKTGAASFEWLTQATDLLLQGQGRALVTAPIAKHAWHAAGHHYPGQTERLKELTGADQASMLFTAISPKSGWRLNTLLTTTHVPLVAVPKLLTPELVTAKLNVLKAFCERFKTKPYLVVAGLNPHAGEAGQLGQEELEWLIPMLKRWKNEHPEVQLDGPLPPDTCWLSAAKAWQGIPCARTPDGILALYHDQGLIPVKLLAFDEAVNTTLGLPFLRTSPDHGTAFDIAEQGCAKANSMVAALKAAWDLTKSN
ncbi:MAG: 4-hydroxythreonine-4-phosphate dehydrogenase PdxA [Prochlorococcus sp.]|nr:4-hydroxythreonine-4-phosphate dehydrogenase PdxA [Prochlorococcaceae cyanobacterium ETNP18_MAG_14]